MEPMLALLSENWQHAVFAFIKFSHFFSTQNLQMTQKKLTALSIPSMMRVMKKRKDQIWDPGRVAMASGYTSNTNPGPVWKKMTILNFQV